MLPVSCCNILKRRSQGACAWPAHTRGMRTAHELALDVPQFIGVSLTYGEVDDVLLACHGHEPLRHDEWQLFLDWVTRPGYQALLVSTLGAEPDAAQRQLFRLCRAGMGRHPARIAVLTTSPGMRWAHLARRMLAGVDARMYPFDAVASVTSFLGCRASADRLSLARDRAQYLLEKRALSDHQAHRP